MTEFPLDEWDNDFLTVAPKSLDSASRLMNLDAIELPDLTQPDECVVLASYVDRRKDPLLAAKVIEQATLRHAAMGAVLEAADLHPYSPANLDQLECIRIVLGHLDGVVWRLKRHFNRPRPYHVCAGVGVLDGVDRPKHASYPSGHATAAHTFAGLIGSVRSSAEAKALDDVAAEVSRNREIAGVHFPSDSAAGKELAKKLVDGMLRSNAPSAQKFLDLTKSLRR